ncbi:MAG TPA: STAS domain-containing protein [Marmoricola sp.]|nr:STAS domain-containing protein [Marmoricola sp.]
MELEIDTTRGDDGVVVRLAGELDMLSAPELGDELTALLEAGETHLVVDLTGLEFLDSSGLSALLGAHQSAQERGASLVLRSPNERIIRLVNIAGLGDVFEIRASRGGEPSGSR